MLSFFEEPVHTPYNNTLGKVGKYLFKSINYAEDTTSSPGCFCFFLIVGETSRRPTIKKRQKALGTRLQKINFLNFLLKVRKNDYLHC